MTETVSSPIMEDGGYRGRGSPGGKWGCAAAVVVGVPLLFCLTLADALGDCVSDSPCHHGFWTMVVLPTASVAGVIGLGVRWLVNRPRRGDH